MLTHIIKKYLTYQRSNPRIEGFIERWMDIEKDGEIIDVSKNKKSNDELFKDFWNLIKRDFKNWYKGKGDVFFKAYQSEIDSFFIPDANNVAPWEKVLKKATKTPAYESYGTLEDIATVAAIGRAKRKDESATLELPGIFNFQNIDSVNLMHQLYSVSRWKISSTINEDGEPLEIPTDNAGKDALIKSFATLPGLLTYLHIKEKAHDNFLITGKDIHTIEITNREHYLKDNNIISHPRDLELWDQVVKFLATFWVSSPNYKGNIIGYARTPARTIIHTMPILSPSESFRSGFWKRKPGQILKRIVPLPTVEHARELIRTQRSGPDDIILMFLLIEEMVKSISSRSRYKGLKVDYKAFTDEVARQLKINLRRGNPLAATWEYWTDEKHILKQVDGLWLLDGELSALDEHVKNTDKIVKVVKESFQRREQFNNKFDKYRPK